MIKPKILVTGAAGKTGRGVQRAYYCPPYHPFVIQSASAFAAAAHLGVFPLPVAGESRNAPPSVDDIARVAVGARIAAFARFMAVPILPGMDPVTSDRAQEQPVPPTPHLALDDAGWMASHGVGGSFTVDATLKEALA